MGGHGREHPTIRGSGAHRSVSVETHAERVRGMLGRALQPVAETVPLQDAAGRVTFEAISSPVDLPLFRNSSMDGFAVLAADTTETPVVLPIAGEIPARPMTPPPLAPGTAVRIMTGAVLPEGADAVVPVEDTSDDGTAVTIARGRSAGEFVRERGSDLHAGDTLLSAGTLLESRHLAALAASGIERVEVRRRIRVAVITSGAELIAPGDTPRLGQIHDANQIALVSAIRACGASVSLVARVTDDEAEFSHALAQAVAGADLVITSGGISAGDYEVVRDHLDGPDTDASEAWFGHVAMQPGGPQGAASVGDVPVICLPGNPVSTQLSFEVFIAPLLRAAAALPAKERASRILACDIRSIAGRRQYLRGRALDGGRVETVSGPGSHLVAGLAASDVLIVVPEETITIGEGDTVETWQL